MNIIIIPGFMGHPDEITFADLTQQLTTSGHTVTKIAWPHFPENLDNYSFSETITHARHVITKLSSHDLIILGFSMGGIIATVLAAEFTPRKLGLIVSPYQAGTKDDLAGKYSDWQKRGYRLVVSSKFGELKVPFSFIDDAQQYNALDVIGDVRCPVLCVVGEQDTKVSPAVTRQLFAKANQPKQWIAIPGMEHKYQYQPEMLARVNKVITEFIGLR